MGKVHSLFRRLPADRDHGGAGRGNAQLRPDEAGRSARPTNRPASLCGGAIASGQCAGHAVEHGGLPDQAEARRAGAQARNESVAPPPATTALGALLAHITKGADAQTFQPMNVNFGLFPPLEADARGRDRKRLMAHRALADLELWLGIRAAAE